MIWTGSTESLLFNSRVNTLALTQAKPELKDVAKKINNLTTPQLKMLKDFMKDIEEIKSPELKEMKSFIKQVEDFITSSELKELITQYQTLKTEVSRLRSREYGFRNCWRHRHGELLNLKSDLEVPAEKVTEYREWLMKPYVPPMRKFQVGQEIVEWNMTGDTPVLLADYLKSKGWVKRAAGSYWTREKHLIEIELE
jgi:hypothetical protein